MLLAMLSGFTAKNSAIGPGFDITRSGGSYFFLKRVMMSAASVGRATPAITSAL
jgi:hypothetical protein